MTRDAITAQPHEMTCRLCHNPIVVSNEYYRTSSGCMRIGNCLCHDYIYDANNNKWSIIQGNRQPKKTSRSEQASPTRLGIPKHAEYMRMNNSVIYCLGCRVRMIYQKDFTKLSGYIGLFLCPSCTRVQYAG